MFDILIIGAGLSGLTTAYKIIQKDPSLRIKILEATDTIGGQIANSSRSRDESIAKLIIPDQTHIYNLLSDFGIHMRRRPIVTGNLKRSWSLDVGPFAFIAKFELRRYMNYLDLKSHLYRPGTYDLDLEDKEYTMKSHIKGNLFFGSSRQFMMNFVRLVAGVDAGDISFIEFMIIIHSCGSLKTLMELYTEPSHRVLEFSSEHLLDAIESQLNLVSIKKESKVIEIRQHEHFVEVSDTSESVHAARVAILAIPCNQIKDIFIVPPIPAKWEIPFHGEKYYITSFRICYDEPHWTRRGFSGNFYSADPPIFTQQYKQACLVGYILHGQDFEMLIKSTVLKSLAEEFGQEMNEPVTYNQQTFEQTSLLNLPATLPWNRLIWSSTSTATLYRGCLNGAVQSGLRAAIHALLILRPQSVTWQDVAEFLKSSMVYRYPNFWVLTKSSLNVYNTVVYSTILLGIIFILKNKNVFRYFKNIDEIVCICVKRID